MFTKFAKWMSMHLGHSYAFIFAVLLIFIWLAVGIIFHFSDGWQLLINTATTIITFLMVFLIQNTQNRDTMAVHLKLDEIIRAMQGTHNELVKVEELSDKELEKMLKRYEHLAAEVKKHLEKGQSDTDTPEV
jgi:low affinity Fe/Cu permease